MAEMDSEQLQLQQDIVNLLAIGTKTRLPSFLIPPSPVVATAIPRAGPVLSA